MSMLSPTEQEESLRIWFEEEKGRPFVWTQPPLLRFQIHLRSENSFQLILSFHHAILDGWSVASLLGELMKIYLLHLSGATTSLTLPPAFLFRDFVAWERKLIASQEARHYWQEILYDAPRTKLPRWTSSSQVTSDPSVYELPVPISRETGVRLTRIAQEAAVLLKSVLLAVHLSVLSLLHGQRDVLTGVVSNGRPEMVNGERTLGAFLNTLPFRLKLSGGTWIELIQATFATECDLLPYRWYSLSEIQKQQGGQALFETLFNFVHFHTYQEVLAVARDTSAFPVRILGGTNFDRTNFTLVANFFLDPISSLIHLSLRCDTRELSLEQVETIGGYYTRALEMLASEPYGGYEAQTLLSAQEREQLLVEWNATKADYPQDRCVHQLFEQQVEQTPDTIALVFEDVACGFTSHVTYAELNRRANQLAHRLQRLGVGHRSRA
jgi:hypothetical protein